MIEGCRIAVTVPSYNEARWIAATVRTMPSFVDDILVVDDASTDDTRAIAGASDPRVWCVRHDTNRGVGAAIVTGYREAVRRGAGVVAVMAGDGQMHPDDLPGVLAPVLRGEADYVKGNRLRHPDVRRTMPPGRWAAAHALGRLTARAIGVPGLTDSQCGFTAISASAIARLDLDALWPRYGYPNDLLARVAAAGLRIRQVDVRPVYRGEASGIRPWHALTVLYLLTRARARRAIGAR